MRTIEQKRQDEVSRVREGLEKQVAQSMQAHDSEVKALRADVEAARKEVDHLAQCSRV